jgi:hypothetical protein
VTVGFLLNLGELAYRKEDRIVVMPLSALWSFSHQADLRPKTGAKCVIIVCTVDHACIGIYASCPGETAAMSVSVFAQSFRHRTMSQGVVASFKAPGT